MQVHGRESSGKTISLYIEKSISIKDLKERIRTHLDLSEDHKIEIGRGDIHKFLQDDDRLVIEKESDTLEPLPYFSLVTHSSVGGKKHVHLSGDGYMAFVRKPEYQNISFPNHVRIESRTGMSFDIAVTPEMTLLDLKNKIQTEKEFPASQIVLIIAGKTQANDALKLESVCKSCSFEAFVNMKLLLINKNKDSELNNVKSSIQSSSNSSLQPQVTVNQENTSPQKQMFLPPP